MHDLVGNWHMPISYGLALHTTPCVKPPGPQILGAAEVQNTVHVTLSLQDRSMLPTAFCSWLTEISLRLQFPFHLKMDGVEKHFNYSIRIQLCISVN